MIRKILVGAALIAASATANALPVLTEGFDDIGTLAASGWIQTNNSTPGGETDWFQGNAGIFPALSGAEDSYIAANYLNAGFGGDVDNWLITPEIGLIGTRTSVQFLTRTSGAVPGDTLSLYYNTTGSTNVADFLLYGTISSAVFPTDWTLASTGDILGFAGLRVRFALRYTVSDTSLNGDYIGIDSFVVNSSVPEPGSLALLAACLLVAPLAMRRRRNAEI